MASISATRTLRKERRTTPPKLDGVGGAGRKGSSTARKASMPALRSDGEITRTRILDAAERLFSVDGFTGVSLRQITAEAEVDLALIRYYFGSKESLFHEVLARRVESMTQRRLDALAAIDVRPNDRETLEHLFDAFLMPLIGTTPEEVRELRNYRALIALVTNSKIWQNSVFKKHYDPVSLRYLEALKHALPNLPEPTLYWVFTFYLGSAVNALAETGRIDRLSGGMCRSSDLQEAARELNHFYATGLLTLANVGKRSKPPRREKQ